MISILLIKTQAAQERPFALVSFLRYRSRQCLFRTCFQHIIFCTFLESPVLSLSIQATQHSLLTENVSSPILPVPCFWPQVRSFECQNPPTRPDDVYPDSPRNLTGTYGLVPTLVRTNIVKFGYLFQNLPRISRFDASIHYDNTYKRLWRSCQQCSRLLSFVFLFSNNSPLVLCRNAFLFAKFRFLFQLAQNPVATFTKTSYFNSLRCNIFSEVVR